MKGKRRHELSENVLAHELEQAKTFLERYGNWIIGALAVVLIVGLVIWYHHRKVAEELANETLRYQSLMSIINDPQTSQADGKVKQAVSELEELAETARNPVISASAAVNLADLLTGRYTQALSRNQAQQAQNYRKKAEKLYQFVIQKYSDRKIFAARAHFGLGILAENQGNWAVAQAEYQKVCQILNAAYPVVVQARMRASRIDNWRQPVMFATTEPSTQPTTTSAPTETKHNSSTMPHRR